MTATSSLTGLHEHTVQITTHPGKAGVTDTARAWEGDGGDLTTSRFHPRDKEPRRTHKPQDPLRSSVDGSELRRGRGVGHPGDVRGCREEAGSPQ